MELDRLLCTSILVAARGHNNYAGTAAIRVMQIAVELNCLPPLHNIFAILVLPSLSLMINLLIKLVV